MTLVRIARVEQGKAFSDEPPAWVLIDTETLERTFEKSPNYVPPPPLTEVELLEQEVYDLKWELESAVRDLEAMARAGEE